MHKFNRWLKAALCALALTASLSAHANKPGCVGKFWNPLTDIQFQNMGSIRVAGFSLLKAPKNLGDPPITKSKAICSCDGGWGITLSFWLPSYLSDVARSAGCIGFLNTSILPGFAATGNSGQELPSGDPSRSGVNLMQVHWAYADITAIAGKSFFERCGSITSEFNLAYLTEPDFVFHNDVYAGVLAPYNALIAATPLLGQMLCGFEAVANTLGSWQDSGLCAWTGGRFPLSGNAVANDSAQVNNMDVQVKFMARQALLGVQLRTTGKDAICKPRYAPVWNAFQHRFQWAYPGKTSTRFNKDALTWGFFKNGSTQNLKGLQDVVENVNSQDAWLTKVDATGLNSAAAQPTAGQTNMAMQIVSRLPKPLNYPTRESGYMHVWEFRQCCMVLISIETVLKSIITNILTPGSEAPMLVRQIYEAYEIGSTVYQIITDPLGAVLGEIGSFIGDQFSSLTDGLSDGLSNSLKGLTGE